MIVLGIDSSTDRLGIGLADQDRIIFEDILDSVQEHGTRIIGLIDSVLTTASCAKDDLGGIAVADGPGSFTGLRIGMAAAKGIALALNIPIVGISTFEIMARRLLSDYDRFFLTAMVRKGELYLCRVEPGIDIRQNIMLIGQEELSRRVGKAPVGWIGRKPEALPELAGGYVPSDRTDISGGELARHGVELIMAGRAVDPAVMEPLYIAPSQAERKFGRK